ncbi:unnamed protein product [Chrysodeixis includens]|uniref:Uncharacterized protein n=1 Tax=Chrysodeixis includens TaxID=689277 RepID=A0A9P0FPV1_CHRIL|nr:unnamed protein product [Chrysodeixis includens]
MEVGRSSGWGCTVTSQAMEAARRCTCICTPKMVRVEDLGRKLPNARLLLASSKCVGKTLERAPHKMNTKNVTKTNILKFELKRPCLLER